MDFGWREIAEAAIALWVAAMTYAIRRFVNRQDAHEERLRVVEQGQAEIKQGVADNRSAIEGLRAEQRENTRQIIQTIRDAK